jgi:predicted transcriptional regulator
VTEAGNRAVRSIKKGDLIVENITIYFVQPVQIDEVIEIKPKVLEVGRKFGKVDVEVFQQGSLVGKALMMVQLLDR